jgi:hypothetical protein
MVYEASVTIGRLNRKGGVLSEMPPQFPRTRPPAEAREPEWIKAIFDLRRQVAA